MAWLVLVLAAILGPQSQAATSAAPVAVDFMVTGADGEPIASLTASEITLKVGGKPREVRDLRFVRMERRSSGASAATAAPPPYGSNVLLDAGAPSRAVVVVIEDESLPTGRETAMREAVGMLLGSLGSRDRVALVTVPHGGLKVDFTVDRERVRQALWQITGQADRSESAAEAACRTRNTVDALTGLLDDLGGGEGPTTVLFFSAGLVGLSPMVLQTRGQAGQEQPVIGRCVILPELFQHLGTAAETARANFYIIPPDTTPIAPPSLEGIEHLAGVTGGTRLALSTASETALARVSRETSGYWVATFSPEPSERDGKSHRVEVRVARPGLTVRTRPGLVIPASRTGETLPAPMDAREILKQGRIHRELPLRVAGYSSREAGDQRLRIVALAEPIEAATTLTSLAVGLFDASGKLVAQWSAREAELLPRPVQAALLAAPGTYRLRAAATDRSGRRGTADFEVDATLMPAGPLRLSSLVAGLSRDGRFLPRLEFGNEPSAMVQLEVYGGSAGMAVGARLDVSDALNGKSLLAMRLVLEATSEPDRFIARGMIPIGALPPGDFVARATVEIQDQPAGRVVRTIRKQPR